MQALRSALLDINAFLPGNGNAPSGAKTLSDPAVVAADLAAIALNELRKDEMPIAIAVLFSEGGVLDFLRAVRGKKEFDKTKEELLSFLREFVPKGGAALRENVLEMKNLCLALIRGTEGAKVKQLSADLLKMLFGLDRDILDPEKLNVRSLFNSLFDDYLTTSSKYSSTVKASLLDLMGIICRRFSEEVDSQRRTRLMGILVKELGIQLNSSKGPELSLLAGVMKALDSLLFALAKEEAQPHLKNIFRAAVYVVQPMQDVSRYDLPKSGIQLLSDHMPLFGDFVMPQAKTLYSYLHANAESKNRDVARLGSAAMDSLLKQIKASLDTSLSDDHLDLFWHFMKIFAATLKDEKAETREISHAIRGLGLLAGVAKRIAPEQLRDLVGAIIRKSSSIQSDDPTAHASSILQAYGYILKEMDDVDDAFLSSIELATSVTILYYPKMYQARRYVAARAIADLLFVFFNKSPALFKSFWNRIAYQALILSCSGVVARKEGESSEQLSVEEPDPLYKENFSFWETLLTCPVNGDNQDDELETFRNAVYNEIIAVMLQLARNLELTTLENNGGETTNGENKSTDATPERTVVIGVHAAAGDLSKLVAANQQDFAIFANFVGFSQLFLPNVRTHSFRPWVFVFGEAIITLSSKLPLISGFYKLMEILYQITRKLDFFEKAVKHEYIGTLHEGLVDELNEGITNAVRRPYILFTRFNKEVAVMMDHFKDDLLASCLRMLLSVPADLVSIPLLSEPLKKAFRLGQSYPPLAVAAMDALEDWHTRMPRGLVRELLPKVLPSLADYIETGDNESGLSLLVDEKLADAGKANMTRKARQKAYKRPGARKTYISNPTDQDEFFHARDFRFRVLMFLGGLGGDSRSMIVTPIENYIAWDTEKHLRFTVPFKDMNLEFYLDDILPRIVEQAENSKDRKIKVVSCELLHSVTVFMIGKSALAIRDPSSTEAKSPFHKLYRRVFPALIRLAVDVDKVTRGVFRTLVFQLIHWLTKNQKYENPETIVMLETCLSAASSDDGPIRDFGAECAAEFLKYSIKHTAANDKTQMNAKSLLNRLFIMCRHSNGMKRLGASLTFSRLYRTFREESALVDQFTFEVLYNLLVSLRNCDRDKAATGTISLCIQAIENYSKIIEVKASIFLKQTPNRRAVDEFESADLAGLVLWLFHETSRNEMAYAQQCMDLFARFCRHITEPRQWLASKLKSNSNFLLNLYESSRLSAPDDKDFSSTKSQLWMKQMVTALDGYTSLIDGSLVHPEVTVSNSKSRFLKAICTFFDRHQSEEYNAHNNVSTPSEKFQFAKLKATVIIKIFLFLSVSLRKCKVNDVVIQDMQSAGIWGSSFCRILYQAIFDPSILGFAVDDRAVKSALSQRLADLSSVLKSKVGVTTWRQICTSIGDKILESSSLIENNASSEFVKTQSTSLNMFSGYLILEHSHTLQDIIATFQSFSIFIEESQKLLLMSLNASEPLEQKRVGDLLEFCLTEPKSQVNCLLKLLGLDRAKSQQDSLTVLTKFIPNISIFCGTHWNAFSKELVAFSHSPVILDLVLAMTEEFLINRSSLGQTILVFMEEFTKNTAFIESLVNSTVNQRRESLLLLWQRLLQIDRRVLQHAGQEFSLIFVKTYLQFLDVSLPLESIANSLQILSSVVESNIMNEQIEKAIIKIVDEVFPLSSSDLMEGSSLQKGYSSALQSFLDSYQQSGSPIIVHAIVRHVCRETNSFTPTIISSLREGASKLTSASFNELVAWLMSFIKREEYPASFRRNVVMIILSPTLYGSNVQFTREFFKCHTLEVIDLLRSEWPRKHEEIVIALNLRIAAWELMQILYSRLPVSEINRDESIIAKSFCSKYPPKIGVKPGTHFNREVIKMSSDQTKEMNPADETNDIKELRLMFHRAAYCTLLASFRRTQKDPKLFKMVFSASGKGTQLWDNIVESDPIHLAVDLERPMLKARLDEYKNRQVSNSRKRPRSMQYLSSQFLASSTLSQSLPLLAPSFSEESTITLENNDSQDEEQMVSDIASNNTGLLDLDVFNQNPCMRFLLDTIEFLHSLTEPSKYLEMPVWMQEMFDKLASLETTMNVKLFLARVVLNYPAAFRPFATTFWRPLAQLIADGIQYTSGINYFIQDICVELLSWTAPGDNDKHHAIVPTEDDRLLIFNMLNFLISHAYHPSGSVLNSNVKIIQLFVQNWTNFVTVPVDCVFRLLQSDETCKAGLYIVSAFVVNGILPHTAMANVSMRQFDGALVRHLGSSQRKVYSAASITIGQLLALYKQREFSNDLEGLVQAKLDELRRSPDPKASVTFIVTMSSISPYYPKLVAHNANDIVFKFPLFPDSVKAKALEALSSVVQDKPSILVDLYGQGLIAILKHRHEECQIMALYVLYQGADNLSAKQIEAFLPVATDVFTTHPSENSREAFYRLILRLYKNHPSKPNIKRQLTLAILKSIDDPSHNVSQLGKHYVGQERLSKSVNERTLELLSEWWMPETEDSFVNTASALILEASRDAPAHKEKLFAEGLPSAKFSDKPLVFDVSWSQSTAMQPLFVGSLMSDRINSHENPYNGVRATQTMDWTPTIDLSAEATRSLFSLNAAELPVNTFSSSSLTHNSTKSQSRKEEFYALRRRAYKQRDSGATRSYFAREAETEKRRQRAEAKRQREERARKVSLIREYREGELPDIEITVKEILDPLQALVQRDNEAAQIVFCSLMSDLIRNVDESGVMTEDLATEQLDHYRDYLRKILTKSTQHHSPLFGAILRILYERPGLAPEISILAQAAISSWNNELGAMVIEKLMANHSERSTKRIRTTAVSSPWAYLAKVYKSMTNMEVYQNIYEYHISSTPVTQVAISLESLGNYFGAARKYQEGLTSEPHSSEASIWMSGQMECLSKLYEWDELLVCLKNEIEDDVRNVWDPERPELLRQYIRAQLRIGGSSALDFLTKSLESEQKRYVLESEYPYELASVYVMNRDWNRANFYIGTFIDMFSTSFTSIHPLSRESRLSVLSSLQKGKELHEFCTSASKSRQGISKITNLIDTWKLRFPSKVDPIDTWDDIITSRYMCLNVFNRISAVDGTQTPSDNTSTISGDMKSADHSAFKLYTLKYISAALKQQNWGLALRLSQKLVDERTQDVQYAILKTWQQRVADEFDKSNQVDSWSILLESIQNKSTISCFQSGGKMWQSKFSLLRSRTYEILVEFLLGRSDVPAIFSRWQDSMGKTIRRIAAESSSEIPNNPQELVAVLCASGRKCLEDGAQKLENTHGQTSQNALFKAQVRLASHCDKVLRLEESGSVLLTDEDRRDYSENLVVYNLRSMCNGIDEAINMFPRLLQLLERHNDLITTFVNQSSNVPTWMFLRWLPQMTAALSTSVAEPVSIILLRVASEYPNALFFPFRISSEGFTPEVLKNVGKSVEKLRTALEFQQMEEFIRELARLGEPVHIFKDWLDRGQDLFEKGLIPELRKSFLEMAELIFETPQNRKRLGAEGLKFSSRHYKKISEICGKDGAKLSTAAAWKSIRKYAQESFRDEKLGSGSTLLKSYSPWLSSFLTDNQEEIEVPGQYTGLAKPVPSWHAKIASFGPTMLTMSSMRRPKRLQINGTDEKEYLWLVKGGEDLRLDQRVEQMFSIMNAMLAKTPYCVAHQVSVSDYKVVPMSVRLGIIEWVPKTMPLRSCMSNHPDFEKELRSVTQKHQEWIASHARGKGVMEAYPVMLAANVKRETLESQMNELWNLCKTPYLRVFLMKLASSIESFLTIRSGFARSLGALNICSYILGIGDRHSDNFLIDLTSGKVIGIDFGHAFGSATEILPIPELVPFRLTKQIQYVLEPLGVSVLMEITMIKVLESLKKNKSTLLNALDVFVKEPLMEWRKFALSQAKKMARMKSSQQATPSSADTPEASFHAPAWYPIQKLEIVRRKLDGDNPAYIVSEELRRGHEEKPWCKNMQLVALGTTKQGSTSRSSKQQASSVATTLRGRIGERCETTKEQVNCLVELATDPAVLLRAYLGWGPYI